MLLVSNLSAKDTIFFSYTKLFPIFFYVFSFFSALQHEKSQIILVFHHLLQRCQGMTQSCFNKLVRVKQSVPNFFSA